VKPNGKHLSARIGKVSNVGEFEIKFSENLQLAKNRETSEMVMPQAEHLEIRLAQF